ncbi:MAG: GAF and ANTAR domain-containing protein [Tetrasphaera sp.]
MDANTGEQFCTSLAYMVESLVEDFDIAELLDRLVSACSSLCSAAAVGFLAVDQSGALRVLASSSEEARHLDLLEVQNADGPCPEAIATGEVVSAPDLTACRESWPRFTPAALSEGILAAYALPLRLRGRTIGALNLFFAEARTLTPEQLQVARVMTSVAMIAILGRRHLREQEVIAEQLQTALDSRVVIEQAKGIIAERAGVDVATAFEQIRSRARSTRRPLTEVATEIARTTATRDLRLPSARADG